MTFDYTLERYDEDADEYLAYDLEVVLDHEPDEYVNGKLFHPGSFSVREVLYNNQTFIVTKEEEDIMVASIIDCHNLKYTAKHYFKVW